MNITNFNKILKKLQMLENAILRQVDYTESYENKEQGDCQYLEYFRVLWTRNILYFYSCCLY